MARIFKCDLCGGEVEHEAQLTKTDRCVLPGRPAFLEIYPEMVGKEICRECSFATDAAFDVAKPETIRLVRQELDKRRVL